MIHTKRYLRSLKKHPKNLSNEKVTRRPQTKDDFITESKKDESQGKKFRTVMHSETGRSYKMNAHHVPLRQSVEEIRLGKV